MSQIGTGVGDGVKSGDVVKRMVVGVIDTELELAEVVGMKVVEGGAGKHVKSPGPSSTHVSLL